MVDETRWLADEMVGRLARYLRFLGYDVEYVRGLVDRKILERARDEDRLLLTRDVQLAQRAGPRAIRLRSPELEEQLREVWHAHPTLRRTVAFVRCSECNGPLQHADRSTPTPPRGVPERIWGSTEEVYVCSRCGQAFWEGSHTREIRKTVERLFTSDAGPRGNEGR